MITERYRSPNYRPELVVHRYVKRISATRYRVYECAAKRKASNKLKPLSNFGAGPTIREYDCNALGLPEHVVMVCARSLEMVAWS